MVATHNRVRLPPPSLRRWRRFVTYIWGVYLDLIKAMRDAARALIFAAQWPTLRDVAVGDMDIESLFNDAMLPEKPTTTTKEQKYPSEVQMCRHRGDDKMSALKKYGTSVGTLTLCDQCGARWVLKDGKAGAGRSQAGTEPSDSHRTAPEGEGRDDREAEQFGRDRHAEFVEGSEFDPTESPTVPRGGLARRARPMASNYNDRGVEVVPMTDGEMSKASASASRAGVH